MEYCIGIDLGGTNIAGGVATLDGRLVHTQSVKTGMPCTPDEIADRIAALCRSLAQAAQTPLEQMAWIGVGAPRQCGQRYGRSGICQQSGIL